MIIDRIWRLQPGKYFCYSTKSATGQWKDRFILRKDIDRIGEIVQEHSDKDVYFCPHGFKDKHRTKESAAPSRVLWSDMDEVDPRKTHPKPTIAFESSPGHYVGIWVTDGEIEETLNRRLSYGIGADKSGWDFTQVLRFPGTRNYKYRSIPRVKILWTNGPEYSITKLEKQLPPDPHEGEEGDENDAADILRKYSKKLPHWVRKELVNGRPAQGKRSEMIWKLENAMLESGVDEDDAFTLIKASPWNKFRGRLNEDQQLRRELDKALKNHIGARKGQRKKPNGHDTDETPSYHFLAESLDEVEEEQIDWIWYPYLARGELTILEGDPGLGKSYLAQFVSGSICDGKKLPSVRPSFNTPTGIVAYFDIENSRATVTKKRLRLNGFKNLKNFYQDEEPFSIDDDERLQEVFKAIEERKPTLVVFDTLNTYIGRADTYKSSESQQAFRTFREIAKRFNCSCLVLRHLTKSTKEKALYRGQGSIAFAGLARVVMTVGVMPDEPETRVVAVTKLNVTKLPKALTFTIQELPDTIKEQDRSKFEFGDFVDLTADDIVGSPREKNPTAERDGAREFLETVLDDGEIEFKKITRMAESRSISPRTLQRAADALGIVRKSKGFGEGKQSFWSLPA